MDQNKLIIGWREWLTLPDWHDLNRFFPGSEKGSLTSRLASIFMEEIVANSIIGIMKV